MPLIDVVKAVKLASETVRLGNSDTWTTGEVVNFLKSIPLADAVALPCKLGTNLWRITTPYRGEPKVTEYVVKNFRTIGKKHQLQIEVQALNTPGTNWMRYQDFYETREEAEAALKQNQKNKEDTK